jgi:hypothetical protein
MRVIWLSIGFLQSVLGVADTLAVTVFCGNHAAGDAVAVVPQISDAGS